MPYAYWQLAGRPMPIGSLRDALCLLAACRTAYAHWQLAGRPMPISSLRCLLAARPMPIGSLQDGLSIRDAARSARERLRSLAKDIA